MYMCISLCNSVKKLSLDPKCFLPHISQHIFFLQCNDDKCEYFQRKKSDFSTSKYFKENTVMQFLLPLGPGQWWSVWPWKATNIWLTELYGKSSEMNKGAVVVAKDLQWYFASTCVASTDNCPYFSEQERSGWSCRCFLFHAGRSICWSSSMDSIECFMPGHWIKQMEFVDFMFHQFQKG